MKKRILSLVLCAAMLLSMCLFLGAGVMDDTTAEGSAESTESYIPAVNFTNVAPFVQANAQAANGPARAPLRASANAAATQAADNGVVTSKTATANDNGTYTITLEAYATGSKVITEIQKDVPTDIVLVLDQSGSMAEKFSQVSRANADKEAGKTAGAYLTPDGEELRYNNGEWQYYYSGFLTSYWRSYSGDTFYSSRLLALKTAVTSFTNAVAEKAAGKDGKLETSDDNIDHRIAVVGFASESGYGNNSELLSISGSNSGSVGVAYNDIKEQNLKDVLQSMKTAAGQTMVTSAINALAANGATRTDLGMDMAKRILSANPVPAGQERNRVVVVFTDGSPTDNNGFQLNIADSAITTADDIKKANATVYSIGIFSGADATSSGERPSKDYTDGYYGNSPNYTAQQMTDACNWFMQNLSSNDGVVKNPSYYLSAADSDSLNSIFKQISDQIESGGSSTTLSSDAVVKDVISPQFQLPKGATAKDIQLETYACAGKTGDTYTWSKNDGTMGATATVENDTVSVTGFDFAGNWCGMEKQTDGSEVLHRGNKLVISFKVVPKAGFLGGNNVYTNDNAAIYESSTAQIPVVTFKERPQVNVPIKPVTVTAQEKNVYLLGSLTADELKADATVKVGDEELNLTMANDPDHPYGLEKWQTDYVNITVAVTDETGNAITDLSNLTDDTKYTVSVTVAPKTESQTNTEGTPATAKTREAKSDINVFKPELTFQDSEVYYGDTAPRFDDNLTSTAWKHGDTVADNTIPMGKAPELTLAFTPDSGAIEGGKINTRQDIGVAVTVKSGDQDVTNATTFLHTNCAGKTCTLLDGKAFLLHVNTCSLTISKTVTGQNNGQSFVFTVKDANGNVITTVAVKGGASKTITGLPIGTYTVTEDTQWSWQYDLTSGNGVKKELKANAAEDHATAEFTNAYKGTNWLTSIADVINKWLSADDVQQFPGKN